MHGSTYHIGGYEWDPEKAWANRAKHGVRFSDAAAALEDELARTLLDPDGDEEEHFVSLGRDPAGRLLVVVYTWRGERIRIISARSAMSWERRWYEEDR
jgi:uncharacterized DUF497 family protein